MATRSKQAAAKLEQGYTTEPLNCGNCAKRTFDMAFPAWIQREVDGGKQWNERYKQEKNQRCGIGGFAIKRTARCSEWALSIDSSEGSSMTEPADAVVSAVAPALDALSVLRKARALIKKPEHWTQDAYGRDSEGVPTNCSAYTTVCFCALGALRVADDAVFDSDINPAAKRALQEAMAVSIDTFNDSHTHAEVLAAFDKAIASLESA